MTFVHVPGKLCRASSTDAARLTRRSSPLYSSKRWPGPSSPGRTAKRLRVWQRVYFGCGDGAAGGTSPTGVDQLLRKRLVCRLPALNCGYAKQGPILLPLCATLVGCGGWGYFVGTNFVGTNKDMRTSLERAAAAGDLVRVRQLLASGADPNDRSGVFGSPLNSAVLRNDNAGVIRALISAGADPNGAATRAQSAGRLRSCKQLPGEI